MLDCALAGPEFVFGKRLVDRDGPAGFVFAFRVLPTVIFVAALFAVLYHLGMMQWVVRVFAWCDGEADGDQRGGVARTSRPRCSSARPRPR